MQATTRRTFIKDGIAVAGATAAMMSASSAQVSAQGAAPSTFPAPAEFQTPQSTKKGDMLYRTLGKTGQEVSLVGLGGAHLGKIPDEAQAIKLIRSAIDRGITFMDNSWDYSNGTSETRMGKALKDGYRDKVFLMTKLDGRTKAAASLQLDESLKRLGVDHVDLIQHHEIIRFEDPDRIFAEGGAQEAVEAAKIAGKVRYIGFTGHKDPAIHLRMLDVAKQHGFTPDTVQMPLNVMDAHFRSFEKQVLPQLVREQIGVLGMKSMGDQFILNSGAVKATECLHYAMSLPTSVVITGIDKPEILDQAFEAVKMFKPLTKEQIAALLNRTREPAMAGKYELFKTSNHFDSTGQNPQWLG
jgi:aryl-alcohol dehydrogenase-like predicted oxidoreductase